MVLESNPARFDYYRLRRMEESGTQKSRTISMQDPIGPISYEAVYGINDDDHGGDVVRGCLPLSLAAQEKIQQEESRQLRRGKIVAV
jgi:hypothetical protein